MRLERSILIAVGLLAVAGGNATHVAALDRSLSSAAKQPAQIGSAPTLQVYSRETVVDVTVTDANGNPVHGLTKADFTVKEDGKPQSIKSFSEATSAVERTPPKLPAGTYSNFQATPISGPVNIILLDLLNNSKKDMIYAKRATIDYLNSMPMGTEVAIFALSANRLLRLVQGFTSDGAAAAKAVDGIDVEWVTPPQYMIQFDLISYGAINQVASYVSGIKGRKNLLLFSRGLAVPLGIDHGRTFNVTYDQIQVLIDKLVDEEVAVSYVNPHGVPSFSADTEETFGSKSYANSNDLKSLLVKAVDDGRSYYTLSYVPPTFAMDNRRHSIEVAVDRSGLTLVYRRGFRADVVATVAPVSGGKLMQASMERGLPPSTELLFDVRAQPRTEPKKPTDPPLLGILDASVKKTGLTRYGFLYAVPTSQITFADDPDGTHRGAVEFDIVAFDADGKQVTMLSQTMQLPLTDEERAEFIETPLRFSQQLDLPPGQLTLRIGILDGISHKVGTMEIPISVPKNPTQRAAATSRPQPNP
jgi:VWFA-related protein